MVKPAARKHVVTQMIKTCHLSERTACRLAGVSRTAYRYQAKPVKDEVLRARLKALAVEQSAYGYLLLHGILKNEGLGCEQEAHLPPVYRGRATGSYQEAKEASTPQATDGSTRTSEPALVDGFRVGPAEQW